MTETTARCGLTDLIVSQCAHCRLDVEFEEESIRQPHAFQARFPSRCPGCSEGIRVGDLIYREMDGYRHKECQE